MTTLLFLTKNQKYLQRLVSSSIKEMRKMDYLEFMPLKDAISHIIKGITSDLNHIIDIYERFNFEAIAAVFSLEDKILEKNNEEFLRRLTQYIDGVDGAFRAKAVTYCNLGSSLKPRVAEDSLTKEQNKKVQIFTELMKTETDFINSIKKVNAFSHKLMEDAKKRYLTHLKNYDYQFKQLALFETLTFEQVLDLLNKNGKI